MLDEDTSNSGTDPDSTLVPQQDQAPGASAISNLLRGGGGGSSRDTPPLTKSSQSPSSLSSLPYPHGGNLNSDSENDELTQNRETAKQIALSLHSQCTWMAGRR